ncbi:MAG TPA: NosD domain-containing protein [Conexibacter sp.]
MRSKVLIALMSAALAGTASSAAAARPQPQPHCGDVITHSVTLTQDLDCSLLVRGAALTVGADGVTLDLGGHRLFGGFSGTGIAAAGFDDVVVRNGTIDDFGRDVVLTDVNGAQLRALAAESADTALALTRVHDAQLASVRTRFVGERGLELQESSGVRIADSRIVGQTTGASVVDSQDTVIVRTTISGEDGLSLFDSDGSRIADSFLLGDFDAARVTGADNELVRDEFISAQLGFGRSLVLTGDRNVVRDGTFHPGFSPQPEIDLVSGSGNVLRGNALPGPVGTDDPKDGILVEAGALDTRLVENVVSGYTDDGIDVESAATTLRGNVANDNGDLGIEAVPGVQGHGNLASGNGNPLQCTGVVCS